MSVSASRRSLLTGGRARAPDNRPPWTAQSWTDACTRCGDCLTACPEQILFAGDGGFPQIRYQGDGCTFCGECASACPEPVFDLQRPAFEWRAVIGDQCLALSDIHCMSCQDACEVRAIRFTPRLGMVPAPQVDIDSCTGCTACVVVCPQNAITMEVPHA